MKFIKFLVVFLAIFTVSQAHADNKPISSNYIGTQLTTIVSVGSYTQWGNGDVIFRVANPISQCYGYWLRKDDAGYETNVSMITSAYQAKTPVLVYGLPNNIWTGSSNKYCKLYVINFGSF